MDFQQIVQYLSEFSGVPACGFVNNAETFYIPAFSYLPQLARTSPVFSMDNLQTAACLLTDESLCYGKIQVKETNQYVIFGPLTTIRCNNSQAQRILKKCGLPISDAGKLLNYFQRIPVFSYQKFCNFILYANFVLNQEDMDITQLLGTDYSFQDESLAENAVPSEPVPIHDAQSYENIMFSMIRFGQYEKIKTFLHAKPYTGNEGILSNELFRHQKNLIIASTTIASRCAVDGGLDYETSMSMADAYIQKIELAPNTKSLGVLHKNMLKTYTKLVWEKKQNNADSSLSGRTHRYIETNINEKLNGQIISHALNVNRSYLSSQFKKETGISLNNFINQCKIDEAKLLLTTTNLSISQIANQLAFSSQSHFQSVFKKITGFTPAEYLKNFSGTFSYI